MSIILETNNLTHTYPDGTKALNGIDIKVNKGEMLALLGPNGSGKTTLFLHFNGILKPSSGKVLLKGESIKYNNKSLINVRKTIGIVFQNSDNQIIAPTVLQDIAFGPLNLGLEKEEVIKRVNEALDYVGMSKFKDKAPHYLSGGQKKMVAIAGILSMKPELIVLDEPTAGLDPIAASRLLKLLHSLNEKGMTIIISTHDIDLVPVYAKKIYLIKDGIIAKSGNSHDIFGDIELIKSSNLRLPRISRLIDILNRKDDIPIEMGYTIGEVRKNIKKFLDKNTIRK
jgi:cobalt/nickel transport system ATP-binding protein